jgi:hypothetical protein
VTQSWLRSGSALLPLLLCCRVPDALPSAGLAVHSGAAPARQSSAAAQAVPQPKLEAPEADVAISGRLRARELRFEVVPNPRVVFADSSGHSSVWQARRIGLPRPVEPGVVYRDVGVDFEIVSGLEVSGPGLEPVQEVEAVAPLRPAASVRGVELVRE